MKIRSLLALTIAASIFLLTGCSQSYYRVTDPQSGAKYYTKSVDKRSSGAVEFVDDKSGQTVTLQSSEILPITGEQFKAETGR